MSSGGQQPVTQQTTQTRDPWAAAQPHLTGIMNQADVQYAAGGYSPYTGATHVPYDPTVARAWSAQAGLADQSLGGTPGIRAAQEQGLNMIQNQGLSPGLQQLLQQQQGQNNPYLQSILDTNNRRIGDRVNASVSGAGRYGSGAHTDIMTRALAESADPILAQDYQQRQQMQQNIMESGQQRAGQWSQMMPTLDQAQYQPAQNLMGLGQYMQDYSQADLNDQIKLYNAQQAYPWEQLSRYQALIGGAGGMGGSTVTSSPIQNPSALQSVLGGASAGAGIGSIFGAPGAAVGGLGGGLLGLLNR